MFVVLYSVDSNEAYDRIRKRLWNWFYVEDNDNATWEIVNIVSTPVSCAYIPCTPAAYKPNPCVPIKCTYILCAPAISTSIPVYYICKWTRNTTINVGNELVKIDRKISKPEVKARSCMGVCVWLCISICSCVRVRVAMFWMSVCVCVSLYLDVCELYWYKAFQ